MAEIRTKEFKTLAADTLADEGIQKHLRTLYSGFNQGRLEQAAATPNWEELRDRARQIKAHTIENLDHYLNMAAENVEKAGGTVYFAKDSEAATKYVVDLAKKKGVRSIIKGKSMLSEEMNLNHHLAKQEIEAVETDLGEYLVQLAGQTPYHIIVPAIHMSKSDVNALFHENLGVDPNASVEELASAARNELREKFIQADMGITGANFLVAETGTLFLVTNEGNGRMSTSMPKTHVAYHGHGENRAVHRGTWGMFLRLLIRSATGQHISSYVTMVTGPRSGVEEDGPDEFHLVIVDNGRSKLLADPHLREALYCIRCGACLNVCPVYRKVGGHSYGWVYSGPHRRCRLSRAHRRAQRQGPALCVEPVWRVQGGLSGQDRPAADAALPAERGDGGQYRLKPQEIVTSRKARNESVASIGQWPCDVASRRLGRSNSAAALRQKRTLALATPAPIRLDSPSELPCDILVPLPHTMEEGHQVALSLPVIPLKVGSGKPVVGATLVVARSRHQPVFIPLCGLRKAMVIPAKGGLCVTPSPVRGLTGVGI